MLDDPGVSNSSRNFCTLQGQCYSPGAHGTIGGRWKLADAPNYMRRSLQGNIERRTRTSFNVTRQESPLHQAVCSLILVASGVRVFRGAMFVYIPASTQEGQLFSVNPVLYAPRF